MDADALSIALGFAATPLGLAAGASLMGWSYRRTLLRSMSQAAAPPPSGPEPRAPRGRTPEGPQLRVVPADAVSADLGPAAEQARGEARDTTTRVRLAYVAAALVYAAVVDGAFVLSTATLRLDSRLAMAYLVLAPQLVTLIWFLGLPLRRSLWVFLGYAAAGSLVALLAAGPGRTLVLFGALSGIIVVYPLVGLILLLTRRMQPFLALLVAFVLYVGAGTLALVTLAPPHFRADVLLAATQRPWLVAVGLVNSALGLVLAGWLLRQRLAVQAIGCLVALAVAELARRGGSSFVLFVLCGVPTNVLQVLLVWLVFKFLLSLRERQRWLTPEILHAHACWGFLTLYFTALSVARSLFAEGGWLRWCLPFALALHIAVLHALLLRIRTRSGRQPRKRLLLLRVFGRADERERLLDGLGDTWRRIGAIDVIAGSDVASRTLGSSMLEAFLLRRSDSQFLETDGEVDARLDRLRSDVEGDARYPVNAVYCYENAWQAAFARLTRAADVVLMDLRGFTTANRGCTWELVHLMHRTALHRVLLLADRTTDLQALEEVARGAWKDLSGESPNATDPDPVLRVLSFPRGSEAEGRVLFDLLLSAAFGGSSIVPPVVAAR